MIKQYILHRILQEEIEAFHRIGIKPNTVVMSQNILGHMEQWKDFLRYYTPAEQSSDFRAKYCGLTLVQATAKYSDDPTVTPGECFVCCAAQAGKLKDVQYV